MRRLLCLICMLLASCSTVTDVDYSGLGAGDDREAPPFVGLDNLADVGIGIEPYEYRLDVPRLKRDPCSALDILFVIDNSGSMAEEQGKLAAAVPDFVDQLKMIGVGIEDGLHVGVVTTDAYRQNAPSNCQFLGALVNRVGGQTCGPYIDGTRYMTENDDFSESFSCASNVGMLGDGSERPIDAMLEALELWPNRAGGCNDGFSRAEQLVEEHDVQRAAFVVVILSDEDDNLSIGEPDDWREHLQWLRGGSLTDTAIIAITGDGVCGDTPFRIRQFLDAVPYSYEGSLCEENFAEIFKDAVPFVQEGCGFFWDPEG